MDTATHSTARREYQRKWMARKRAALKANRGVEEVKLTIPKALAAELRAKKPFGVSLRQWLIVFLRDSLRSADQVKAAKGPDSGNQPRNAPCACGSGKKFKACCGKPA